VVQMATIALALMFWRGERPTAAGLPETGV